MQSFASLVVMVSSACCAQIKFLGVPAGYLSSPSLSPSPSPSLYTAETLSPSIYPLRTALDVLNTFPSYAPGAPVFRLPGYPFSSQATLVNQPEILQEVVPIQVEPAPLPAPDATEADVIKAVDVAAEEAETDGADETAAPGLITVAEEIDALPSPPASFFRDPTPVIPAGIAQATQPIFHQQLFKNPKLSPLLVTYPNSKVSPVLQQIQSQGAIVV